MTTTGRADDKLEIAIVGAGRVGSSTAFAALVGGLADTITLVDFDPARAEGEAMDLIHGLPFVAPASVRSGGLDACRDADVIVLTAGAARQPGDTRLDLAKRNLDLFRDLVPRVVEQTRDAVLVVVSNPVDLLTLATQRLSGLPSNQVLGSGTMLDTARLRSLLAQYFGIDARSVHAHVIGEHGDSQVVPWSQARLGGAPIGQFARDVGKEWSDETGVRIRGEVAHAGAEVIRRKGATHYAIGLVAARLARTIARNERSVLTVSTPLEGQHGLRDVSLSLPCVVGRTGVEHVVSLPLEPQELQGLTASAKALQEVYEKVGGPPAR